jgi:hypothetical protein
LFLPCKTSPLMPTLKIHNKTHFLLCKWWILHMPLTTTGRPLGSFGFIFVCFVLFRVLWVKTMVSYMISTCFTSELQPSNSWLRISWGDHIDKSVSKENCTVANKMIKIYNKHDTGLYGIKGFEQNFKDPQYWKGHKIPSILISATWVKMWN